MTPNVSSVLAGPVIEVDRVELHWTQAHGKLKARWRRLTDADLITGGGSIEYLATRMQERPGIAGAEPNPQIEESGLEEPEGDAPAV